MTELTHATLVSAAERPLGLRGRALVRRHPIVASALLAVILSSPALLGPPFVDDLFHAAVLRPDHPVPLAESRLGMFAFLDHDAARTEALAERGVFPWWRGERTRFAFFRPLAELSHRLDYLVVPTDRRWMHLHDLGWAFALVCAVGVLHRRVLGAGRAAAFATLLFAIDDAHGLPFGWTAHRNAVIATTFGALSIAAFVRARERTAPRWAAGSVALFALSLLSAESGIATLAYLGAHTLTRERREGLARFLPLAPHLALVVLWRVTATALGYGVVGSGLYVDPLASPLRFAALVFVRIPLLLLGAWTPVPSEIDGALDDTTRPLVALGALVALALLFGPLARHLGARPEARFHALGMLLSLVPVAATFPSDRLLLFAGIGATGLLGAWIADPPATHRNITTFLAATHLVLAPVLLPVRAYSPTFVARYLAPAIELSPELAGRDVVLLDALDLVPAYAPLAAALEGREGPRSVRTLAPGATAITLERVDARTLRVTRDRGWLTHTHELAFFDPEAPFVVGDRRRFGPGTIEVLAVTSDGRPASIALTTPLPLEEAFVWRALRRDGTLRPLCLPAPGEHVRIAPVL